MHGEGGGARPWTGLAQGQARQDLSTVLHHQARRAWHGAVYQPVYHRGPRRASLGGKQSRPGCDVLLYASCERRVSRKPDILHLVCQLISSPSAPITAQKGIVMPEAAMNLSDRASAGIARRGAGVIQPALRVLVVGFICHFSTEIGFAFKFPPHYISPLWPTGAILFSVLVVTPIRHWWAYTLAAYFTSIVNDARAGFPVSALLFVAAGLVEIFIAAVGVRRFAGGLQAFDSLSNLVAYIVVGVVLGPLVAAFLAAFAGTTENYWFYWRGWVFFLALALFIFCPVLIHGGSLALFS